jgi:hypothetical protein
MKRRSRALLRYQFFVIGKKTKTIKVKSPAEERLPAAHLPAELAVGCGGRGDVKSLAHHRSWARAP